VIDGGEEDKGVHDDFDLVRRKGSKGGSEGGEGRGG